MRLVAGEVPGSCRGSARCACPLPARRHGSTGVVLAPGPSPVGAGGRFAGCPVPMQPPVWLQLLCW